MNDESNPNVGFNFSQSCKAFKKKKALAFFILILDRKTKELKHREMLRIVNPKGEEYYLIPRPLDKSDFHISYHESGAFHWKINKELHFPKEQEKDFGDAFHDYLGFQSVHGWIVGYCIAHGPGVDRASLEKMLKILAPYVPVPGLGSKEAIDDIFKRKHVTQWNRFIKVPNDIKDTPLALGVMLVELNDSIGILQTINCVITDQKNIMLLRRSPNPKNSTFELKHLSQEDIHKTHFVLM